MGGEVIRGQTQIVESAALESITRGEIDVQITTAHRYPRDVERSIANAKDMALCHPDTASTMFYVLPARKGGDNKPISGPSIRLAEIIAVTWGNLRVQARIVEEGEKHIVAQGVCHDLENNVAASYDVRRSIWGKNGRYSENMIQVAANAACAIAFREAVFHVVPRVYINQLYDEARRVAVGDVRTLAERVGKMSQHFVQMGVTRQQLLAYMQREKFEDVTKEDLEKMLGVANAITQGEATIEDYFNGDKSAEKKGNGSTAEALSNAKPKQEEKPAEPKEPPAEKSEEKPQDNQDDKTDLWPTEAHRKKIAALRSEKSLKSYLEEIRKDDALNDEQFLALENEVQDRIAQVSA